jgi:hypothetical protein
MEITFGSSRHKTSVKNPSFIVNIYHGSSCVGKSYILQNKEGDCHKLEMDQCEYWREGIDRIPHCIKYLSRKLTNYKSRRFRDVFATCGALPRPSADIYTKLELEYNILFKHILILLENIEKLKEYSEKREKEDGKPTTELVQFDDNDNVVPALSYLENYKWRERTKDLYDEVIYN